MAKTKKETNNQKSRDLKANNLENHQEVGKEEKVKKKYEYVRKSFTIGKKANGKPERIWVRGKTDDEAEENLREVKRLYARGLKLGEMTVNEWSKLWMKAYKADATENQKNHYAAKLRLDILPAIGSMRVMDVRKSHLQMILSSYSGGKKGTVEKIRNAMRQLFADAVEEGIIERDPSSRIVLPTLEEKPRRPLTCIEREAVINAAKEHHHGAPMLTMLYTGLRISECVALTRGDIDLVKKRLVVNKAILLKGNKGNVTTTKAEKMRKKRGRNVDVGTRVVPIPDILLTVLENVCVGKKPKDRLFPKTDGKNATQSTVTWWWKSFTRQCHIKAGAKIYRNGVQYETSPFSVDVTPHYLRHTYATDLYAAGVDDKARHDFLGHAQRDVTDIYTKMSDEAFKRALNLMNDYYSRKPWCTLECIKAKQRWDSFSPEERNECGKNFATYMAQEFLNALFIGVDDFDLEDE